jgi:peptide deformylase
MEKSMHQSHGMGYAEYQRSLEKRMIVERKREKEYKKSLIMVNEFDRKLL